MHDPGPIVPHIQPKVITGNQMSRIKYNYYMNNLPKDCDDSQQNGTVEGSITPQERQPGQHVAYNSSSNNSGPSSPSEQRVLSSKGKIARLSTLMVGTEQVQELNDMLG
jgi:hypothetical protein